MNISAKVESFSAEDAEAVLNGLPGESLVRIAGEN